MNKQTTAEKIRTLRKAKGLSQETLAENAGINLRTLQRIESGNVIPRGETLRLIAQALEVSVEELSVTGTAAPVELYEDQGFLKLMNLSALSFWFIPLGNMLVPFALWMYKRNSITGANELGKRILNFQITWSVIWYGVIFVGVLTGFMGLLSNPFLIFGLTVALAVANSIFIISNNPKIARGEEEVYGFGLKIIE
nr:helix-turn-helix domain-containing protein [uncultured Dyadobacter sp.]